jgi:hypothetical protein
MFAVGCPAGWNYIDAGPFGLVFRPPQPLPGGVESLIVAFGGQPRELLPNEAPQRGHALLTQLERRFRAQAVVEGSGRWHGVPSAVWFRGRINDADISGPDAGPLDGFVLVTSEGNSSRVFVIAAYPAAIYSKAFTDAVRGLSVLPGPVRPYAHREIQARGVCRGQFTAVSPAPYQAVEAFIIRFNTDPTVEITDTVTCKPRPPGSTECHLLDGISEVSATGSRTYRIVFLPTATDAQVARVRALLERSPYVASYRTENR